MKSSPFKTNELIALVYSHDESEWSSCKKIVKNLVQSYELALSSHKILKLNYSRTKGERNLFHLSEKIIQCEPAGIIFVDHQPHPSDLVSLIASGLKRRTKFIFHVYGDFIIPYPEKWVRVADLLKNHEVSFIAASGKQVQFIQQFLIDKQTIEKSPFPVDPQCFKFDLNFRQEARTQFELKDDEFIWLYSGRLSSQKNITKLIQLFARHIEKTNSNDKLLLVGLFDSMGTPYLNKPMLDHEYYHHYQLTLKQLPPEIRSRILYKGIFLGSDLNKIYCAADGFISLSTHNDEDYGMAVAEAMMTGLPCILTNWAGYSSFKDYHPETVKLANVSLTDGVLVLNEEQVIQALKEISESPNKRNDIQKRNASSLSIQAVSENLLNCLTKPIQPFSGFSPALQVLSDQWNGPGFSTPDGKYNSAYETFYECYLR
jgi:glycosyltransferase involved in cell wall biosynthesis